MRHLTTLLLALGAMTQSAFAGVDATALFLPGTNPNGQLSLTNGPFNVTPMNVLVQVTGVTGQYTGWTFSNTPGGGPYPYTMVAKTDNVVEFNGGETTVIPRGQLFATTGIGNNASSFVTLTMPAGNYDVNVQVWRPTPNGNGHVAQLFVSPNVVLPVTQSPGMSRGIPRQMFSSASTGQAFAALQNIDVGGEVSWDTSCVNLSYVRLDSGVRPMVHGTLYMLGWEGKNEEIPIKVEVRSPSGQVWATGSSTVMSTGQFEVNVTPANAVPNNTACVVWVKAGHWLAFSQPFSQFVNGVCRVGNPPSFNTPTVISPTNGDVDGDNEVSILDYIALSNFFSFTRATHLLLWAINFPAYGAAPRDADLDGDDEVSILDYIILSANYGLQGVQ